MTAKKIVYDGSIIMNVIATRAMAARVSQATDDKQIMVKKAGSWDRGALLCRVVHRLFVEVEL